MDTINPHACREGFEQQRKAGINVDWFTWQIAWHDAMFTQVDCAPRPTTLTDERIEQIARSHGTGGWQSLDDMKRFARALIAAREST
ncbi:MAG: hypothetical protein CPSOU_1838 [uncultured Paraburkholderia sp.]|nr:MAG: hypothetical protein CPSOU_1838 [uncultured Paraburkholderia sp.]